MRMLTLLALAASTVAATPHQRADIPLLSYLQVGPHRIAFEADTILEGGARIALVQSTFTDARRALGPASVSARGDAGDSFYWVCYRLTGSPRMSLILESDEMGGGTSIDNFELVPAGSRASLEHRCVATDIAGTSVVTNTGLRLGSSRADVNARLGMMGRDSAGIVVYDRSRELTMRYRDGRQVEYTQSAGFVVRFVHDHVASFTGYRLDAS